MSNKNQSSRYVEYLHQQWEDLDDPTTGETSNQPELYHHDQSQQTKDGKAKTSSGTIPKETKNSSRYDLDHQKKFEAWKQFPRMANDLSWNMTVDRNEQQPQTMTDVVLLPTKINQVSTNTTTDGMGCLIEKIQTHIEKIPDCLTKHNQSFKQMLQQVQSTSIAATTINDTHNKDAIRKVAILIYKMMIINNYHLLWTVYLKSGLGELIIAPKEVPEVFYATTIPIWPKQIKTLVSSTNINKKNENEIYFNFVNRQLNGLHHQLQNYQNQLYVETNGFHGYTLELQKMIEEYIEQNLRSFRTKIEHEMELTRFDYHIRALKLEFSRHNPNQYQEELMREVCRSKYEQETTEQEYHFLKQQINYYSHSPDQSFQSSPLGQSTTGTLMNLVENVDRRGQLFEQFKVIAEQARNDMFQVYIKSAEEQMKEYNQKYGDNVQKMWTAYRRPIDRNQKISQTMIQFITQRCHKIGERIQCIYKCKAKMRRP